MIAPLLDASSLDALKRALLDGFPHVKSSYLTEALAFGLGFRTHAESGGITRRQNSIRTGFGSPQLSA